MNCLDCDGGRTGWPVGCPSCGGSGTRPDLRCGTCRGLATRPDCPECGTRPANVYANDESKSTVQTRPAVTDADLAAAARAWCEAEECAGDEHLAMCWGDGDLRLLRAALEAAARARQENRDG